MFIVLLLLLLTAAVLNWLSKKYVFLNLSYRRGFSGKTVEINENFELKTTLENKKVLPVAFLQVYEQFPDEFMLHVRDGPDEKLNSLYGGATLLLLPMQRVTRRYSIFCARRGRCELRFYTLSGGDLLGFDTVARQAEDPAEIVVLPRAAQLENEIVPYGDFYGDYSVKRWIIDDPVMTVGVREYTGAEPLRVIHWPSSLKAGSLMVRKFDFTTDNAVLVLLNTECATQTDKVESCLSIARAVIEQLEEAGTPYGFATNAFYSGEYDEEVSRATGLGAAHMSHILEGLGRVNYYVRQSFKDFLTAECDDINGFASLILITPAVFEHYIGAIDRISRKTARTALISLSGDRLSLLNDEIMKYTEKGE